MNDLKDAVVAITGASPGIGRATASAARILRVSSMRLVALWLQ